MNRFILFVGDKDPLGGVRDIHGSYKTLEAARQVVNQEGFWADWAQVLDVKEGSIWHWRFGRRNWLEGNPF